MIVAKYPNKKAIKAAIGKPLHYQETSMFGPEFKPDGDNTFVGPGAYNRKFYGTVTCSAGVIVRVR